MQTLEPAKFQGEIDGKPVALYVLRNSRGMLACITNFGAKIQQLLVPDREGSLADVVLGYDSLNAVVTGAPSMGAFIGRYAGRIGNAGFSLGASSYRLGANNGRHCLHGGIKGSRHRVFDAVQRHDSSVEMRYVFADGEEGFPGTLELCLVYRVTDANELLIEYDAIALDKPTVASFTTHAFFNLNGESSGSALDHEVMICADRYLAMTTELVATGEILSAARTPFDLRQATVLGMRLRGAAPLWDTPMPVNEMVDGYDSCYLVNRADDSGLALCARVCAPASGRTMEVWSTEPALQFYTGLSPQEPLAGGPGKSGQIYFQQQSLCFEPQGYPNAPNLPGFPTSTYLPGVRRAGRTLYRFGIN